MRIRVHAGGPGRDKALRQSIGRCFGEATERFAARIRGVLVYAVEAGARRHEASLHCQAAAEQHPYGTLVADDRDRTAQAAVAQTAARLAAVIARRLRPRKDPRRSTGAKRMAARRPADGVQLSR